LPVAIVIFQTTTTSILNFDQLQSNGMASAQELQLLIRFLSQDAKVPLGQALGKIKDLQAAKLVT
jgi:hypothetical protein